MSTVALEMVREQVKNEFILHPNSRDIVVVDSGRIFPAIFDRAFRGGKQEKARVNRRSRQLHLTCYSGNVKYDNDPEIDPFDEIETDTVLEVNGKQFRVQYVDSDETDSTYQADIWLTVVPV